jgi:hypothetical protein
MKALSGMVFCCLFLLSGAWAAKSVATQESTLGAGGTWRSRGTRRAVHHAYRFEEDNIGAILHPQSLH